MLDFREEKGVSAIIGFTLIVAIVMMALAVHLTEQVPQDWRELEYERMLEVKSAFLELGEKIQNLGVGEVVVVEVPMGTLPPTAMASTSTSAGLEVISSRSVDPNYLDAGGYVLLQHVLRRRRVQGLRHLR